MSISARLPPVLKEKIAALLRLQASDSDGEALNASRAITRLLQRHGASWHDVVDALLAEPQAAPRPKPYATSWKRTTGPIDLSRADLIALLDLIERHSGFFSLKSRGFLTSLRSRAWRPQIRVSEKQWCWLQSLLEATAV